MNQPTTTTDDETPLKQIERLATKYRSMGKHGLVACFLMGALCVVSLGELIAHLVWRIPFPMQLQFARLAPNGLFIIWVWSFIARRRRLAKQCEPIVSRLADVDDVESAPALLDCLAMAYDPAPSIRILTRVLPRLRPDDAGLLNSGQRATLYRYIDPTTRADSNEDFSFVVLAAVQNVGDAKAVPYLERLIGSKRDDVVTEKLKTAARECLEVVQARVTENAGRTLLRPSQRASSIELLHPASSHDETPAGQLLRPSHGAAESEAIQASETSAPPAAAADEPAVLRQKR